MRAAQAVAGGLLGGGVGVALWTGVVYFTGYELGILAAFLGIFVGVGVAMGAGPNRGGGTAVLAGAIALLAVLGGKGAVAWVYAQQFLEENMAVGDLSDEFLVSCLADEVVAEYEWEGYHLDYPPGADLEYPDSRGDYPEDVWAAAESQWLAMTDEQRATYRESVAGTEGAMGAAFLLMLIFSFGLFDLLWIGIAVSSAYRIARDVPQGAAAPAGGGQTAEAEPAPMFLPGLPPPTGTPGSTHTPGTGEQAVRKAG